MEYYFKENYYKKIKISSSNEKKLFPIEITKKVMPPFFCITTEKETINQFLKAIATKKELAENYLAKGSKNIDMRIVEDLLEKSLEYKYLIDVNYKDKYKKYKKNSLLIINEDTQNSILHIFLKHEPDNFSDWKIYCIEKEY